MVKGKYKIYDGNDVVAEFDNIITDRGKDVIGAFLAGQRVSWSDSISIGAGESTPQTTDQFLDMEFWREEVDLRSYDAENNQISLRSRIPASLSGNIYELSVHAASSSKRSFSSSPIIATFNTNSEQWSTGSGSTSNSRIGGGCLDLSPGASSISSHLDFEGDIRAYTNETKFRISYVATGTITSLGVRFKSTDSDYREYTFSPTSSGYQIESWGLEDFSIVGNPQWNEVYRLEIIASGSGLISLDGLSAIEEILDDPSNILVSRALVNFNSKSFFEKKPQRELQIEYILDLDI